MVGNSQQRLETPVLLSRKKPIDGIRRKRLKGGAVPTGDDLERQGELQVVRKSDHRGPPDPIQSSSRGDPFIIDRNSALGPPPLLELDVSLRNDLRIVGEEERAPSGLRPVRSEHRGEGQYREDRPKLPPWISPRHAWTYVSRTDLCQHRKDE